MTNTAPKSNPVHLPGHSGHCGVAGVGGSVLPLALGSDCDTGYELSAMAQKGHRKPDKLWKASLSGSHETGRLVQTCLGSSQQDPEAGVGTRAAGQQRHWPGPTLELRRPPEGRKGYTGHWGDRHTGENSSPWEVPRTATARTRAQQLGAECGVQTSLWPWPLWL